MKRITVRLLLAVGTVQVYFEIRSDAPEGRTNVECVRGCQLAWIERMVPGTVTPNQPTFTYSCSNSGTSRCASGRVGGWIKR